MPFLSLQAQEGEIYDVPKHLIPTIETKQQEEPKFVVWEKKRTSDQSSRSSSGVSSELGRASRGSGASDLSTSRPGSDSSDKGVSTHASSGVGSTDKVLGKSNSGSRDMGVSKRDSSGSGTESTDKLVAKRGSGGSGGKRASNSSADDDYVDYQEIYGYGRAKPVNLYDVPVQVSHKL